MMKVINIVLLLMVMVSCNLLKRSSKSQEHEEVKKTQTFENQSKITTIEEKTFDLPSFNLLLSTQGFGICDTLEIRDTIIKEDPLTNAQLMIYINKYNELVAECRAKGGSITEKKTKTEEEKEGRTEIEEKLETETKEDKKTKRSSFSWWLIGIAYVAGIFTIKLLPILLNRITWPFYRSQG